MFNIKEKIQTIRMQLESYGGKVLWELNTIRKHMELNSKHIANQELSVLKSDYLCKQYDFLSTMEMMKKNKLSLVRFGDGEFRMMFREVSLSFQKYSPEIREDLVNSFRIANSSENILIALPHFYEDLHWLTVWVENKTDIELLLSQIDKFGNAHITRPIFFSLYGDKAVELWRDIWKNENITVVTGRNSRFSLLPELFDSARSVDFIYSEPKNAYEALAKNEIESSINHESSLILVALGPAGTILAARLANKGYWVMDIGHISNSYQTVFSKASWPEKLSIISNK